MVVRTGHCPRAVGPIITFTSLFRRPRTLPTLSLPRFKGVSSVSSSFAPCLMGCWDRRVHVFAPSCVSTVRVYLTSASDLNPVVYLFSNVFNRWVPGVYGRSFRFLHSTTGSLLYGPVSICVHGDYTFPLLVVKRNHPPLFFVCSNYSFPSFNVTHAHTHELQKTFSWMEIK